MRKGEGVVRGGGSGEGRGKWWVYFGDFMGCFEIREFFQSF